MSELDVLNPTFSSDLNPDYPLGGEPEDLTVTFRPRTGMFYTRDLGPSPHRYELTWLARPKSVADQVRQWYWQFRHGYFTFYDYERGRGFTGNFLAQPKIEVAGFNKWNVSATFIETSGAPMREYPAGFDSTNSYYIDESDGSGNPLVKLDPGWSLAHNANYFGGAAYIANATQISAEWLYDGYGFQIWAALDPNGGKLQVWLDGVQVMTGASDGLLNLNGAATPSAALFSKSDVPFGRHRLGLVTQGVTGIQTPVFLADAIRVRL